jgi:hypothetical protein
MMAYRRGPERDNVVLSAAIGKASRVIMTTKPPTASKCACDLVPDVHSYEHVCIHVSMYAFMVML